jgi:hypothetical protein
MASCIFFVTTWQPTGPRGWGRPLRADMWPGVHKRVLLCGRASPPPRRPAATASGPGWASPPRRPGMPPRHHATRQAAPPPRHPACRPATRHAAPPPRRPAAPPPGKPPRHPAACVAIPRVWPSHARPPPARPSHALGLPTPRPDVRPTARVRGQFHGLLHPERVRTGPPPRTQGVGYHRWAVVVGPVGGVASHRGRGGPTLPPCPRAVRAAPPLPCAHHTAAAVASAAWSMPGATVSGARGE